MQLNNNNEDFDKKTLDQFLNSFSKEPDKKYSDNDTRYFTSKYFSKSKYSQPLKYFIFDDKYKKFRTNVSSSIHPVIPSIRLNLGQGYYGRNFVGLNYINLNENNTDSTGEVFWHEQIHSSNPNLSEKEVRDQIRIKYDFTDYH
jgi:hypothetical protein